MSIKNRVTVILNPAPKHLGLWEANDTQAKAKICSYLF